MSTRWLKKTGQVILAGINTCVSFHHILYVIPLCCTFPFSLPFFLLTAAAAFPSLSCTDHANIAWAKHEFFRFRDPTCPAFRSHRRFFDSDIHGKMIPNTQPRFIQIPRLRPQITRAHEIIRVSSCRPENLKQPKNAFIVLTVFRPGALSLCSKKDHCICHPVPLNVVKALQVLIRTATPQLDVDLGTNVPSALKKSSSSRPLCGM